MAGYLRGIEVTKQTYQKKVIEAVEIERKIQEKDEQRKAALRDADAWHSVYEYRSLGRSPMKIPFNQKEGVGKKSLKIRSVLMAVEEDIGDIFIGLIIYLKYRSS